MQIKPKTQETVRALMLLLCFSKKFSNRNGRALSGPVVLNNHDLQNQLTKTVVIRIFAIIKQP